MKCVACDRPLSDLESVRKNPETGEYLDLCHICLAHMDKDYLETIGEIEEENEDET